MERRARIRACWFGDEDGKNRSNLRFGHREATDAELRAAFGRDPELASEGRLDGSLERRRRDR